MTRVVGTPLRVTEFSSPSDEAISARVSGDSIPRIRIDAGGRITWGSGSGAGDLKLYRTTAQALYVEGVLSASLGLITTALSGSPTTSMPNGAIVVDNNTNALYFRANDEWVAAGAGQGNASLTISDTPPPAPEEGDLWFESDSGKTFVYYDSFWIETGGGGATGVATDLSELGDVALSSLSNGDFLRYNSSASVWTNDPINLSADTIGDYVAQLTAGTGVSITNNSGEGASPTIAIGQAVATTSSVTFAAVTSSLVGNADTASALQIARTISLTGDVTGSVSFSGASDASITTTIAENSVALGTDTTGNYVASLVAGTGISLANNSGEGATPTISIGQSVGTSSSVQFAGIRNTDFSNFGLNSFTKATVGAGEIAIDNGTTDTPGLLMYYANNNNWGIDSSPINGSQSLRFVTNLNETGGTVRASIDANGNMVASTFRGTDAGSVLKDTMLDNSQVTVVSTTAGSTGSMVNFITYNYTPVSSSSYLIVHIHISKYTMAGTTDDSWYSQINVDGSEIAYGWQMVNDNGQGTSGRSGVLFPLTGRYTNSNTTAKTIGIAARRDSADDSISIDNSSTAIWLRITEVAR